MMQPIKPKKSVRDRTRTSSDLQRVIDVVSSFYGIADISNPIRSYPYGIARGIVAYLMYENVNGAEIARKIGLARNSVIYRYRAIKDEIGIDTNGSTATDLRLIENELKNQTI